MISKVVPVGFVFSVAKAVIVATNKYYRREFPLCIEKSMILYNY